MIILPKKRLFILRVMVVGLGFAAASCYAQFDREVSGSKVESRMLAPSKEYSEDPVGQKVVTGRPSEADFVRDLGDCHELNESGNLLLGKHPKDCKEVNPIDTVESSNRRANKLKEWTEWHMQQCEGQACRFANSSQLYNGSADLLLLQAKENSINAKEHYKTAHFYLEAVEQLKEYSIEIQRRLQQNPDLAQAPLDPHREHRDPLPAVCDLLWETEKYFPDLHSNLTYQKFLDVQQTIGDYGVHMMDRYAEASLDYFLIAQGNLQAAEKGLELAKKAKGRVKQVDSVPKIKDFNPRSGRKIIPRPYVVYNEKTGEIIRPTWKKVVTEISKISEEIVQLSNFTRGVTARTGYGTRFASRPYPYLDDFETRELFDYKAAKSCQSQVLVQGGKVHKRIALERRLSPKRVENEPERIAEAGGVSKGRRFGVKQIESKEISIRNPNTGKISENNTRGKVYAAKMKRVNHLIQGLSIVKDRMSVDNERETANLKRIGTEVQITITRRKPVRKLATFQDPNLMDSIELLSFGPAPAEIENRSLFLRVRARIDLYEMDRRIGESLEDSLW